MGLLTAGQVWGTMCLACGGRHRHMQLSDLAVEMTKGPQGKKHSLRAPILFRRFLDGASSWAFVFNVELHPV